MDRFIASVLGIDALVDCDLKSNMDRFIEHTAETYYSQNAHLKSNMDRFIVVVNCFYLFALGAFKIQYG